MTLVQREMCKECTLNLRLGEDEKTDLERFVEVYKSFGIDCVINEDDPYKRILFTSRDKFNRFTAIYYEVTFYKDGKFISQGFWK